MNGRNRTSIHLKKKTEKASEILSEVEPKVNKFGFRGMKRFKPASLQPR